MKLVENGKLASIVIYDKNRDATDCTAVAEYCLFTHYCTNLDTNAYSSMTSKFKNYVFIGEDNAHAKALGVKVPREKFTDDTIYILVKDNYVVLDGGKRGKLYAVYEFLERFWGVRFYGPDQNKTPFTTDLEVKDCEIIYTPPFKIRTLYSTDVRWNREFAARSRSNSSQVPLSLNAFGGSIDYSQPQVHTTYKVFFDPNDPELGIEKHPEYYSYDPVSKKRVGTFRNDENNWGGSGDICWTNPEVIDILIEKTKQWILDDPDNDIFAISMNDWGPYCQCEECTKIAMQYGYKGTPRWSAPILWALNKVGKAIKEWQKTDERVKDRTIYIETLAYKNTVDPPIGLEVEDNIIVRFVAYTCYRHQMEDEACPINQEQIAKIDAWKKVAKSVFLWDYSYNYSNCYTFHTVNQVIQSKYKLFAKKGIIGVFNEFLGDGHNPCPWFVVEQYLYAKLLWNPDIDFTEEMREAMNFFYGEGGPYMMEVERRFQEGVQAYAKYFDENLDPDKVGFHLVPNYLIEKIHFSDEFLSTGDDLFQIAMEKAKKPEHKLAIRKEYALFKFCKMYLNRGKDYREMQEALDELDALGIKIGRIEGFKSHYYGGPHTDWFLDSIAERNRLNLLNRVSSIKGSSIYDDIDLYKDR